MFEEPGASPWEHTLIAQASSPSQPEYEAPVRSSAGATEGGGDWARLSASREQTRELTPDEVYERLQRALEDAQIKKAAAEEKAREIRQQIAERQARLERVSGQPISLEEVRAILKKMEQEMDAIDGEIAEASEKLRPFELIAEADEASSLVREEFERLSEEMELKHRETEARRQAWREATRTREAAQSQMLEWQNAFLDAEAQYGQELEGLRQGVPIAKQALEEVLEASEHPQKKNVVKPGDTRTYAQFADDMRAYLEQCEPRFATLEQHFQALETGSTQAAAWASETAQLEKEAAEDFVSHENALNNIKQRRETAYAHLQSAERARAEQSAEVLFRTQQENARRRSVRTSSAYH